MQANPWVAMRAVVFAAIMPMALAREGVSAVSASTNDVINQMYASRENAVRLEAQLPDVMDKLDAVPARAEAAVHKRRVALEQHFQTRLAAVQKNASESSVERLASASARLKALDARQLGAVRGALDKVSGPALQLLARGNRNASVLQERAHKTMDPLYSMGDAAEDLADNLNDKTTDAQDALEAVTDHGEDKLEDHSERIVEHARAQLEEAERRRADEVHQAEVAGTPREGVLSELLELAGKPAVDAESPSALIGAAAASAIVGAALVLAAARLRSATGLHATLALAALRLRGAKGLWEPLLGTQA